MEDSEYKKKYEELQLISNNANQNFKLYLLKDLEDGSYKMAKKMPIFQASDSSQDEILNQVKLLKDLNNPHILKYHDIFLEVDDFIVILEFCEEGQLSYYLKKRKQRKELLSEKLILSWLMQILMALQYIHNKNIIYRAVSSHNIYMNHQGDMKLGSFGLAKILESSLDKAMTVVGSPCNLAPEIVEGKPYNNKADIWSLGCLIYELATFSAPYQMGNLPELYDLIVKKSSPELPIKYSKFLNPIYKKMMKKNPSSRPSASQLLHEQVFLKLMKQYTKKKKIDSLDLREITPKQLAIHKKKNVNKSPKLVLPPLHPGKNQQNNRMGESKLSQSGVRKNERNKSRQKSREKLRQKGGSKQKQKVVSKIQAKEKVQNNQVKSPILNKSPKSREKKEKEEKEKEKQENISPPVEKNEKQNRLTKPNMKQGQYISIMYEVRLELLQKKYSPNMSQIFEQTIEFQE